MCIAILAWQLLPDCPLLLLSNRDEFYARPTQTLHQWHDAPIVGGRDVVQSGTWLGVNQKGQFGLLTNYREVADTHHKMRSRGHLVTAYLTQSVTPMQYARQVEAIQQVYAGFNLLIGNGEQLVYLSNRGEAPQALAAGVYVLSNGLLSQYWEKTARLRKRFTQELLPLVQQGDIEPYLDMAWSLLEDERKIAPELLPDTGIAQDWEYLLSSTFINSTSYGTRCSNVLQIKHQQIKWWEKQQHGDMRGMIQSISLPIGDNA